MGLSIGLPHNMAAHFPQHQGSWQRGAGEEREKGEKGGGWEGDKSGYGLFGFGLGFLERESEVRDEQMTEGKRETLKQAPQSAQSPMWSSIL